MRQVRGLTTLDDARAVAADWDRLAVVCHRPASAPGWALPWFEHIAADRGRLHVVEVREAGELIGVLPAWRDERRGGATLRLLGADVVQRIGLLSAPGREVDVSRAVAEHLAEEQDLTPVRLEGVSVTDRAGALLAGAWPGGGAWRVREQLMAAPVVTLHPAGHEAWLAGRSAGLRRTLGKQQRRLERAGGTVSRAQGDGVHDAIEALVRLHGAEWGPRGEGGLPPGFAAAAHAAADELGGRLWLHVLRAGGAVRAVELQLEGGSAAQAVIGAYEPVAGLSPGLLALEAAIREAHARGLRHVDLCGGDQPYKARLADTDVPLVWWTVVPPGVRGVRGVTAERRRLTRALARRLPFARRLRAAARSAGLGTVPLPAPPS